MSSTEKRIGSTVIEQRGPFDPTTDAHLRTMAAALTVVHPSVATNQSFWITFGVQYKRRPPDSWNGIGEPHPFHPNHVDGDGYVRVEAPSMERARELAYRHFGTAWAFAYDHAPEPRFAPLGELGVIDADGALNWHEGEAA